MSAEEEYEYEFEDVEWEHEDEDCESEGEREKEREQENATEREKSEENNKTKETITNNGKYTHTHCDDTGNENEEEENNDDEDDDDDRGGEDEPTLEIELDSGDEKERSGKRTHTDADSSSQRRKRPRVVRTLAKSSAHEIALRRCEEDLLLRVHWLRETAQSSAHDVLVSVMLSLQPSSSSSSSSAPSTPSAIARLESLAQWLAGSFRLLRDEDVTREEGRDGSTLEDLLDCALSRRAGTAAQLCQLWLALLRGFSFRARLVGALDPVSLSPWDHADLVNNNDESNHEENGKKNKKKSTTNEYKEKALLLWSEVWLHPESSQTQTQTQPLSDKEKESDTCGRWVCVHPLLALFNTPQLIEQKLRRGRALQFAVAVEVSIGAQQTAGQDVLLRDVTARYNFIHRRVPKTLQESDARCRLWLQDQLSAFSSSSSGVSFAGDGESSKKEDISMRVKTLPNGNTLIDLVDSSTDDEEKEERKRTVKKNAVAARELRLEERELSVCAVENKQKQMPSTFAQFKDHPVYLLQRHLLADEALHPEKKKIVAVFKGEPVYLQEVKEKLKTKIQWRKELRRVLRNAEPVRVTKRSVRKKATNPDEGTGGFQSVEWKLFGSWQTEAYVIPPVVDGVLPVNKHGNIEVWGGNTRYVPVGAVFVEHSIATKAATSLGVPFAPALVGFEQRGPVTVPKIGGIVVLRAHEQLLRDAIFEMAAFKEEQLYNRKEQEILEKWKRLTRRVLTRNRLRVEYGH